MWFVRILFWLQAFSAVMLLFDLIIFIISRISYNSTLVIVLIVAGAVAGVCVAEYIRRKWGLENFFGRIYGPNAMDERGPKDA